MTSGISYGSMDSTNITIQDDRRYRKLLYGDNQIVRSLCIHVGAALKRHPNYTSAEEKKDLELILGEETSGKLDHYIVRYQQNTKDPIGLSIYDSIEDSYELSLEKCERLRQFILNRPFLTVLSNEMCVTDNNVIHIFHPITIGMKEQHINALAGEKFGILQERIKSSEVKIWAVSQQAFDALERVIAKFERQQNRTNHVIINMQETTPLMSSRTDRLKARYAESNSFWKGVATCCSLVCLSALGVGGYYLGKEFDII